MSKRKPLDKAEARERRDRLVDAAAAAELSLTDGVREMRAISGMTQEDFARHRGVSARVIKALELGQGNPTVATLNRIGQFFGLEVTFVPIKRASNGRAITHEAGADGGSGAVQEAIQVHQNAVAELEKLSRLLAALNIQQELLEPRQQDRESIDPPTRRPAARTNTASRKKKPVSS